MQDACATPVLHIRPCFELTNVAGTEAAGSADCCCYCITYPGHLSGTFVGQAKLKTTRHLCTSKQHATLKPHADLLHYLDTAHLCISFLAPSDCCMALQNPALLHQHAVKLVLYDTAVKL